MTLSGDDIIEACLLKPTKKEHGESPTLERNPSSWTRNPSPKDPWTTRALRADWHTPPQSPLSKWTLLVPLLCPKHPNLATTISRWQRNPRKRLGPTQTKQASGSTSTYRGLKRVPKWGREFWSLLCSKDEYFGNVKVKGLSCQQSAAFRGASCSALPRGAGTKGLPSPKRLPGHPRLSSGVMWRNGVACHGPPEVHHPF